MNRLPLKPLAAFGLKLLLFLPPALALWWFAGRDAVLLVLEPAMRWLAKWLMADTILTITAQEAGWLVKTSLSPLDKPLLLVALMVSPARVTVSFPLLWGLVLATPEVTLLRQLAIGTLLLVPINLLMIGLLIQFELALYINHQPLLGLKPPPVYLLALPYSDYLYYLFGVGRQLALLVLPTLAPILLWGLFNRRFIDRLQCADKFAQSVKDLARPAATGREG